MKISWKKIGKKIPRFLTTKEFLAVILVLIAVFFVTSRGGADIKKIQTIEARVKTIESVVTASGTIRSEDEASLRFLTSGKLTWIGSKEGDYVSRGQEIASLDTQDLEKRLKKDLNLYFKTRLDFEDTKDSQKDKVITDALKRIAERSQADLDNAVIDVEIRDLAIQFSKLSSPINGRIVEKSDFFALSNVTSADVIFKVSNFSKLNFVAEIDETEIGKIKVGQKATIILDAFTNKPIETTVNKISPQAIMSSTGATAFEVTFQVPRDENLLLGMNGEAKIVIDEKKNALTIPTESLVDEKYVWIAKNGKYVKREIKTGIKSDSEAEVIENLKQEDQVVTNGFAELGKNSLIQKIFNK